MRSIRLYLEYGMGISDSQNNLVEAKLITSELALQDGIWYLGISINFEAHCSFRVSIDKLASLQYSGILFLMLKTLHLQSWKPSCGFDLLSIQWVKVNSLYSELVSKIMKTYNHEDRYNRAS